MSKRNRKSIVRVQCSADAAMQRAGASVELLERRCLLSGSTVQVSQLPSINVALPPGLVYPSQPFTSAAVGFSSCAAALVGSGAATDSTVTVNYLGPAADPSPIVGVALPTTSASLLGPDPSAGGAVTVNYIPSVYAPPIEGAVFSATPDVLLGSASPSGSDVTAIINNLSAQLNASGDGTVDAAVRPAAGAVIPVALGHAAVRPPSAGGLVGSLFSDTRIAGDWLESAGTVLGD